MSECADTYFWVHGSREVCHVDFVPAMCGYRECVMSAALQWYALASDLLNYKRIAILFPVVVQAARLVTVLGRNDGADLLSEYSFSDGSS